MPAPSRVDPQAQRAQSQRARSMPAPSRVDPQAQRARSMPAASWVQVGCWSSPTLAWFHCLLPTIHAHVSHRLPHCTLDCHLTLHQTPHGMQKT